MSNPANTSAASVPTDRAGNWFLTYDAIPGDRWLVVVNHPDRVQKIVCSDLRLQDVVLHIISTMEK